MGAMPISIRTSTNIPVLAVCPLSAHGGIYIAFKWLLFVARGGISEIAKTPIELLLRNSFL